MVRVCFSILLPLILFSACAGSAAAWIMKYSSTASFHSLSCLLYSPPRIALYARASPNAEPAQKTAGKTCTTVTINGSTAS